MKKALPILLIIGCLGLILQVAVNVFIVEKNSNYALKTKDNHYNIIIRFSLYIFSHSVIGNLQLRS